MNSPATPQNGTSAPAMPAAAVYDPNPAGPQLKVHSLLVYEYDKDNQRVPLKTMKITNNHPTLAVYPIMRDGNEATLPSDPGTGLYDPYDTVNREYRGYIGYKEQGAGGGDVYYFGLKPGQSILVRLPLVFWNGARMGIVTDGRFLTPDAGQPNPLQYDQNAQCVITDAESDPADPTLISNGVVMWYGAGLRAPALDSPDQLVEWTVRDADYLSNPAISSRTHGQIPEGEKVTLINYDVSYVDNLFLPVAMEALDVPVPAPPYPPGKNPAPYGWIGSVQNLEYVLEKIQDFTADNKNILGDYFGGKGWPAYNMPKDALGGIKIPSGQNIFAQSPYSGTLSSYGAGNNTYMLSSGGTGPIKVNIGGQGEASSGDVLTLSSINNQDKIAFLQAGLNVQAFPPAGQANPISPGTKILKVLHAGTNPDDPTTVQLDRPLIASQSGCTFDFSRPVTDYAADALIKLWYSWARYYLEQTASHPCPQPLQGAVETNRARLSFAASVEGLIEGMEVSGPGLDNADPAKLTGGVTVLAVAADKKSVTLSQLARATHPLSEHPLYTFTNPKPLPSTPADLYALDFSKDPDEACRQPLEFAQKVYSVMAAMAQIPKDPDPHVATPHLIQLMLNVVGGNVGFIFDSDERRFSDDGLAISALIRDKIKSVLRGVSDFTQFPEFDAQNQRVWYPDPAAGRGGLAFNAYNLDPFVRFVHATLGFSGYGFSLDDDTADVGAGQATKLHVLMGGGSGLPNAQEWTIQAVYGPVTGTGEWDPDNQVSFYSAITGASNESPIAITSDNHGLSNGETIFIDQVEGNTAANGQWTVANASKNTFELAGSAGSGAYSSGGRWSRGPLYYIAGVDPLQVYWKLKGDDRQAGFTGALVTGAGVQKPGSVRIVQLGDNKLGILALNAPLTNADGTRLAKGSYQWTFAGKLAGE